MTSRIWLEIKGWFLDFSLYLYILACGLYLAYHWTGAAPTEYWPLGVAALALTMLARAFHDSPGCCWINSRTPRFRRFMRSIRGITTLTALALTIVTGWLIIEIQPVKFLTQAGNTVYILKGIFHPNTDILLPMLGKLVETIFLALLATVLAIPCAFVLSFAAARNLMPRNPVGNAIYVLVRTIATVFRSIEAIVWAIIFSVWVGIGPFAGMLALMIHSIASLVKLYSEQIENIDPGPVEAVRATGANTLQVWLYAVVPQVISPFLAYTIYRWDINVRMATIVGFVGGGGIGLYLQQYQQLYSWRNVGTIMWLIALTVWVMDMVSASVREKLQK
jgi:phosphonate transport system permease protein